MTKKKLQDDHKSEVVAAAPAGPELVAVLGPAGLTIKPGAIAYTFEDGRATLPRSVALALVNDKGNAGKFRLA